MTLEYDPSGINPDNEIQDEIHIIHTDSDPVVIPKHHPFFKNTLAVRGTLKSTGIHQPLRYLVDYLLSPPYVSRSLATGKQIYSYIIILDTSLYSDIRLDYHSLGGLPDSTLWAEIEDKKSTADVTLFKTVSFWADMQGEELSLLPHGISEKYHKKGVLEIIAEALDGVQTAIENNPANGIDFLRTVFVENTGNEFISGIKKFVDTAVFTALIGFYIRGGDFGPPHMSFTDNENRELQLGADLDRQKAFIRDDETDQMRYLATEEWVESLNLLNNDKLNDLLSLLGDGLTRREFYNVLRSYVNRVVDQAITGTHTYYNPARLIIHDGKDRNPKILFTNSAGDDVYIGYDIVNDKPAIYDKNGNVKGYLSVTPVS